jgi:predicted nucleotidyltransferase
MHSGTRLDANTALLSEMVDRLGELANNFVFVGGCATGLLITTARAQIIRGTDDVDVVVQVATIVEYQAVEKQLIARNFVRDRSEDAPICRWLNSGLKLDVLPSHQGVLSFHNRWYPLAMSTAVAYQLPAGNSIQLVTAPLFIATKIEAFRDRGNNDYGASHDLEDIVTVIDGREELDGEMRDAPQPVREYLGEQFSTLISADAFISALPNHLPPDAASQARAAIVLSRLKSMALTP